MEPLLQNGTVFRSVILEDRSRKMLEKESLSDAENAEEDRGGSCYGEQQSGALSREPSSLGCHQLGFPTIQLPEYFGDDHPVCPMSKPKPNREPAEEPVLQCPTEGQEKEAKKNGTSRTPAATFVKAAPPGDPFRLEKVQTGNQRLSSGRGTCPSTQCSTALTACSQPSSKGLSLDGAKERELLEEPLPLPARKKTRTFYSSEQLEELERMFLEDHYPDSEKRKEIAAAVGVTPQRVMVWFQNRRAKWRKMEKLTMRCTKKCSAPAHSTSQGSGPPHSTQGAPLLPKPALFDVGHNPSSTVELPLPSGLLSAQPALLASASVGSVTGRGTPYEAVPAKAVSQDLFPAISSPPPIRRASLPLGVAFNPNSHTVPLRLNTPSSEYSPSSSQESSSSEVLTFSSQSRSSSSPMHCSYPEQLEPTANLETPYYHPPNQYSQPQAPPLYHFPIHLTSSVLSGVCLTSATPNKPSNTLFSFPGNGGYPQEGSVVPYLQSNVGGQLLIQPSTGNSGYIPALQAVPWNEFYVQEAPVSNQLCTQVQFSTCGGGPFSAEQTSCAQKPCATTSACLMQLPRVTLPGSTLLFTTKQAVPAESHLNPEPHSLEEHMELSERDSDTNHNLKEEENADDFSAESKN